MAALVGGSLKVVVLVLGFLLWDRFAVVTRAATQQIRNQDFVSAARAAAVTFALWNPFVVERLDQGNTLP